MKGKLLITAIVLAAIVAAPAASAAQFDGPGGPGAGGPIVSTRSAVTDDEFDWIAAGVVAALATGLGLGGAGLLRRSRQRSTTAMPQH